MDAIILKQFNKSNRRNATIAEMLKAMVLSRSVSSTKCANYLTGTSKKASKIKRVERFYSRNYLSPDSAVGLLSSGMKNSRIILSMDRTNWEYGKHHINALVVYGINEESSGMLNLELLNNKGGNSNFADREQVLEPVIKNLSACNISALLGDREFFSFKFVDYLIQKDVPFVIRIKENLKFVQPLIRSLKYTSKTWKNQVIGRFGGKEVRLDLSAKKLKDEYLLTVSYKVSNPLKLYRKRWSIECFFKSIKTAGFNIENTRLRHNNRLRALFLLCGIAYAICTMLGNFRHHKIAPMRFKKTLKCHQFSFFRYGLDWITELIFSNLNCLNYINFPNLLIPHVR